MAKADKKEYRLRLPIVGMKVHVGRYLNRAGVLILEAGEDGFSQDFTEDSVNMKAVENLCYTYKYSIYLADKKTLVYDGTEAEAKAQAKVMSEDELKASRRSGNDGAVLANALEKIGALERLVAKLSGAENA